MRAFIAGLCLLIATNAAAQSTSVGVSASWDVVRFNKVDLDDRASLVLNPESIDGEALGFVVNVRQAIGDDWGVAVEFSRSGEIETTSQQQLGPIFPAGTTIPGVGGLPTIIRPDILLEFHTEQQHLGLSALAWVRQEVGDRFDLSYLGGVAFVRSEFERDFGLDPRILAAAVAISIAPSQLATTEFNVAPIAGVDADFELTDHTAFTAGIRLQGLSAGGRNGWLIRPAVGVRWTF